VSGRSIAVGVAAITVIAGCANTAVAIGAIGGGDHPTAIDDGTAVATKPVGEK